MAIPKTKKTEMLTKRIDPQLKADLEAAAAADGRSLSDYIDRVLRQHLEADKAKSKRRKN